MIIMNWIKNNKKLALVGLLTTSFSMFMVGMDNLPTAGATNGWLLYGDEATEGIKISDDVFALLKDINDVHTKYRDPRTQNKMFIQPASATAEEIRKSIDMYYRSLQRFRAMK